MALRLAHLHDQRHDQAAADRYRHLARLERKRRAGPTPTRQRARLGRDLAAEGLTPGRNDPCRCGSGKKYKRCHLAADERRARAQESRAAGG